MDHSAEEIGVVFLFEQQSDIRRCRSKPTCSLLNIASTLFSVLRWFASPLSVCITLFYFSGYCFPSVLKGEIVSAEELSCCFVNCVPHPYKYCQSKPDLL